LYVTCDSVGTVPGKKNARPTGTSYGALREREERVRSKGLGLGGNQAGEMSLDPGANIPAVSHSSNDGPIGDALDECDNGDEDRPRFCSLDPPSEVYHKEDVRSRGITTHAEFSEACRRGQVRCVDARKERAFKGGGSKSLPYRFVTKDCVCSLASLANPERVMFLRSCIAMLTRKGKQRTWLFVIRALKNRHQYLARAVQESLHSTQCGCGGWMPGSGEYVV